MPITLTVAAGMRARTACPVAVTLEGPAVASLTRDGQEVPCQARPLADGRHELRFVVDNLPAGESAIYTASEFGEAAPGAGGLVLTDSGSALQVHRGDTLLTAYHYLDPQAARPYWFPVLAPNGSRVTRAYPMEAVAGEKEDHPHHRSMWVAYGDVNGADNWSEAATCATMAHRSWNRAVAGPVCVEVEQQLTWLTHGGEPVLEEQRLWRYYDLPAAAGCLWDVEVDLTPAAGVPEVVFGDTKEGGLAAVRVATSMDVPQGVFHNSAGGINEGECWGKRAHWCDYSGPVGGETVGVAIFDHPSSFRHPTWWHVRNYGLMTANCFGLSDFTNGRENGDHTLPAGETLRFRYRLYVHDGDHLDAEVATRYQDYANPPAIRVG